MGVVSVPAAVLGKGDTLGRGWVGASAVWRVKNREKFEKLQNGSGVSGMHGNGMGIFF